MFQASDWSAAMVCLETANQQGGNPGPTATPMPTVLVVDDDADNLYLLSQILEPFTCTLVCAMNGQTALNLVEELQPDLVLLDIWLPGASGLDIVRAIRENPVTQSIPVVAVTALASAKDRAHILQAGFDLYISKPYLLEDMEAVLGVYLRRNADTTS
jgi:CheY-like chemotaxis protein